MLTQKLKWFGWNHHPPQYEVLFYFFLQEYDLKYYSNVKFSTIYIWHDFLFFIFLQELYGMIDN